MVLGHKKQLSYLKKIAEFNKIPHALLFSGPKQVGKKTTALEWALFLLKEEKQPSIHPDLILVEPEEGEIKISQIRDLIWKLSLKPYSAPLKMAIIDEAEKMNQDAQNCLLKTLEEPAKNTILVLISEHQETLLPTIISRCQIIKFFLVAQKEIEDYLKNPPAGRQEREADPVLIGEILDFSFSLPGRAIEFLENPEKLAERKKIKDQLDKIADFDLPGKFQIAKEMAEKENIAEILEIWLDYFRQKLLFEPKAKNILSQILTTDFLLSTTNVNSRLALENLMLAL
jgi:DNA polymerase III subunit delta'